MASGQPARIVRSYTKGTILITGAAGFIGSHLVERLRQRGERLLCLDNFDAYYSAALKRQNLSEALDRLDSCFVQADIRDHGLLERLFKGHQVTTVVHLAARAGVRASLENPVPYFETNVLGTLSLLEACRTFGVKRFVFASSSSVYGESHAAPAVENTTPCRPLSPYGASKLAAETLCELYSRLCDMTTVALRFFTVYGPRQRPDMAIRRFTKLIDEGKEVFVYGDGSSSRDYTFVTDTVDGIEAALRLPLRGYQVFNLGRGQPVTLLDLIGLIEQELESKARVRFLPHRDGDPLATCADINKARTVLGYHPTVPIEQGIACYVQWFKELGDRDAWRAGIHGRA